MRDSFRKGGGGGGIIGFTAKSKARLMHTVSCRKCWMLIAHFPMILLMDLVHLDFFAQAL